MGLPYSQAAGLFTIIFYCVVTATGEAMQKITPPRRAGKIFAGYFLGQEGAGTKYYNADGTSAQNWDLDVDTTLYAKWE